MADRVIVYPGAIPLETDLLYTNKFSMMGLAKLASLIMGTTTYVRGLACTPTSPASMVVNVSAGEIYSLQNVDGTAYSSIPADTTHSILKQGLLMDAVSFTLTAPSTSGYSVNYLIQVTYSDTDGGSTVLPYYNATDPSTAWSGPNNSGTAQYTVRQGLCTVAIKSGVPATTGTQTTPAPDTGYTSLYVITVAQGASTVVAGNISQASGAPFIPSSGLIDAIQKGTMAYAVDTGTVNAYIINTTPKITSPVDGLTVTFRVSNSNNGTSTVAFNGLAPAPLNTLQNTSLSGGEMPGGTLATIQWSSSSASWSLITNSGPLPVATATRTIHAVPALQVQTNYLNYAADSGTANAYVIAPAAIIPTPAGSFTNGQPFTFKATNANTGASTLKVGNMAIANIVSPSGSVLQGGEITANGLCTVFYNSSLSAWTLTSSPGSVPVAPALQSGHAVNLGQLQARTPNLQRFTSSGTWTCPAGVTTAYLSGCAAGAGGGGGGGSVGSGASAGAGGGGGAGASAVKQPVTVVPGTVYTITIGSGGVGGNGGAIGATGSDGTDGGNTSFGALLTLTGGGRGFGGGGVNPSNLGGGFGGSYGGGGGGSGSATLTLFPVGGVGGSSPFGTPGGATRNGTSSGSGVVTGTPGFGYGAGGGGGGGQTNSTSGIGSQGQVGLPGLLMVEW